MVNGKVVVVVGGRGFLGQRFCDALTQKGARVYSLDKPVTSRAARFDRRRVVADDIKQMNVDVASAKSVDDAVKKILKYESRIDVFIYSVTAKPTDFYKPFTECSLQGWKTVLNAELDGAFLTTQRIGRVMEKQRSGSIIFLSSIYGVVGNDQRIYQNSNLSSLYAGKRRDQKVFSHAAYPAAKGGIISLTKYLAAYWGDRGIRVNCVSPGGIEHPAENAAFVKAYSSRVPLGRKAKPDEITGAILFLSSEDSSYVTGHNLIVDGGWTAW